MSLNNRHLFPKNTNNTQIRKIQNDIEFLDKMKKEYEKNQNDPIQVKRK